MVWYLLHYYYWSDYFLLIISSIQTWKSRRFVVFFSCELGCASASHLESVFGGEKMEMANKQRCGQSAHQPCWDKDNTCLLLKSIYINIRMEEERTSGDIIHVCLYRHGRRKKGQELSSGLPLKGDGKERGSSLTQNRMGCFGCNGEKLMRKRSAWNIIVTWMLLSLSDLSHSQAMPVWCPFFFPDNT